jgi:hypothetical protein
VVLVVAVVAEAVQKTDQPLRVWSGDDDVDD